MKRIGIISTYKNINYGSNLQNYALQTTLKNNGYKGENIAIEHDNSFKIVNLIKKFINTPSVVFSFIMKRTINKKDHSNRRSIFNKFMNEHLNHSDYSTISIKNDKSGAYYKYICGSDQIWAPNQFNKNYFLSFVEDENKKIAYAPSIGLPEIPESLTDDYRNLINTIGYLSIRESDGAKLVKDITGRRAEVVLDPTLLLTKNEWQSFANTIPVDEPYILTYFLGNNKEHRSWVKKLSKKTGYKIVVLPFATRDYFWGDERLFHVGPQEFVGLIQGAEIVCTDSYHGMLFSLNLNKDFYSFLRFKEDDKINQNSRVQNLFEKLGLNDRIVEFNKDNNFKQIDWTKINSAISIERKKSLKYLAKALEG